MAKVLISTGPTGIAAVTGFPPPHRRPQIVVTPAVLRTVKIHDRITRLVPTGLLDANGEPQLREIEVQPEVTAMEVDTPAVTRPMTDDEYAAHLDARGKLLPEGHTDAQLVDRATVPADRTFRNAWVVAGAALAHDMPKARDIQMDRIRVARDDKLIELDLAYQRADETKDETLKGQIAAEKQRLRDIPQTFDLAVAATADELKVLWPAELDAKAEAVKRRL